MVRFDPRSADPELFARLKAAMRTDATGDEFRALVDVHDPT